MGVLPRAIYLDPIEDYLLREEGFSGRSRKAVLDGLEPLVMIEYDNLEIAAHMARIQSEFQNKLVILYLWQDSDSDNEEDAEENGDTRAVVLTEWGIDILNFRKTDPIRPFDKPKIRSPQDRRVHIPAIRNCRRQRFEPTFRYGSYMNTLACSHPDQLDRADQDCLLMKQQRDATIKNKRLTYQKVIKIAFSEPHVLRGSSFRGRGVLDVNKGWISSTEKEAVGDITSSNLQERINSKAIKFSNSPKNLPDSPSIADEFAASLANATRQNILDKERELNQSKSKHSNSGSYKMASHIKVNASLTSYSPTHEKISSGTKSIINNNIENSLAKSSLSFAAPTDSKNYNNELSSTSNERSAPLDNNTRMTHLPSESITFPVSLNDLNDLQTLLKVEKHIIEEIFTLSPVDSSPKFIEGEIVFLNEINSSMILTSESESDAKWLAEQKQSLFGNWRIDSGASPIDVLQYETAIEETPELEIKVHAYQERGYSEPSVSLFRPISESDSWGDHKFADKKENNRKESLPKTTVLSPPVKLSRLEELIKAQKSGNETANETQKELKIEAHFHSQDTAEMQFESSTRKLEESNLNLVQMPSNSLIQTIKKEVASLSQLESDLIIESDQQRPLPITDQENTKEDTAVVKNMPPKSGEVKSLSTETSPLELMMQNSVDGKVYYSQVREEVSHEILKRFEPETEKKGLIGKISKSLENLKSHDKLKVIVKEKSIVKSYSAVAPSNESIISTDNSIELEPVHEKNQARYSMSLFKLKAKSSYDSLKLSELIEPVITARNLSIQKVDALSSEVQVHNDSRTSISSTKARLAEKKIISKIMDGLHKSREKISEIRVNLPKESFQEPRSYLNVDIKFNTKSKRYINAMDMNAINDNGKGTILANQTGPQSLQNIQVISIEDKVIIESKYYPEPKANRDMKENDSEIIKDNADRNEDNGNNNPIEASELPEITQDKLTEMELKVQTPPTKGSTLLIQQNLTTPFDSVSLSISNTTEQPGVTEGNVENDAKLTHQLPSLPKGPSDSNILSNAQKNMKSMGSLFNLGGASKKSDSITEVNQPISISIDPLVNPEKWVYPV